MIKKGFVLKFPHDLVDKPVVCKLAGEYNLEFNILKASITPKEEGFLILEIKGLEEDYLKGVEYLKSCGLSVEPLSQEIKRRVDQCTHCGLCVGLCPAEALYVNMDTRKVEFDSEKCTACEMCVKACPVKAMEVGF